MRHLGLAAGVLHIGALGAVAVGLLARIGVDGWWSLIQQLAGHGHYRVAVALALLVMLPIVLAGSFAWSWLRRRWLPYAVACGVALILPALLIPRWPHLVPAMGWVLLIVIELLGAGAVYAVVRRATGRTAHAVS